MSDKFYDHRTDQRRERIGAIEKKKIRVAAGFCVGGTAAQLQLAEPCFFPKKDSGETGTAAPRRGGRKDDVCPTVTIVGCPSETDRHMPFLKTHILFGQNPKLLRTAEGMV